MSNPGTRKSCIVPKCLNTTANAPEKLFFVVPFEPKSRKKWMQMMKRTDPLSDKSCVYCCEDHFDIENDMENYMKYRLVGGRIQLKKRVFPHKFECQNPNNVKPEKSLNAPEEVYVASFEEDKNISEPLEVPVTVKVCRVCLSIERKMYNITEKLLRMYENVVGIYLAPYDELSKWICWECTARLKYSNKFKQKAVRANELLSAAVKNKSNLSIEDIDLINKGTNKLKSSLIMHFTNDHYDLITEHEEKIKEEFKLEIDLETDVNKELKESKYNEGDRECNEINDTLTAIEDNVSENSENNVNVNDDNTENNMFAAVSENEGDMRSIEDFSESVNSEVKRTLKPETENKDSENVVVLKKVVSEDRIEECKKYKAENLQTKTRTKKRIGVEKKVKLKEKSEKRVDFKKFSPSEIIERYRTTEVVQRSNMEDFTVTALKFEDQIVELQNRQESVSYRRAPYKCTVCYTGFQLKACLDTHLVRHSEKHGQYECFICKKRFISYNKLRRHITALHTEQFACNKCDYVTRTKSTALKHQNWHLGKQYPCPHCDKVFSNYTTYFSHVRIGHPSKYACELCGYTFISLRGVYQHKKKRHNTGDTIRLEGPFCESCDITFASQEAHDRHLVLSTQHNKEGDRKGLLNDPHRLNRPGGREFPPPPRVRRKQNTEQITITCELCDKKLNGNREYNTHIKTYHPGHNRTKYVKGRTTMCEVCGKIFTCEAALKGHMVSHTGAGQYKCQVCGKQFGYRVTLRQHQTVHSAVTHACPHCHRTFTFQQNLHRHVTIVHGGVRRYRCDICGKLFSSAGNRKEHITHVHQRLPRPKRVRARITSA